MDLIDKTIQTIELSILLDSPITLLYPGLLDYYVYVRMGPTVLRGVRVV